LDVSNTTLILCFISCKTEYCNPNAFLITWFCILFFFDIIANYLQKSILTITDFFFLKCQTSKTHNAVFFITVLQMFCCFVFLVTFSYPTTYHLLSKMHISPNLSYPELETFCKLNILDTD
jgi:hypothetical protein